LPSARCFCASPHRQQAVVAAGIKTYLPKAGPGFGNKMRAIRNRSVSSESRKVHCLSVFFTSSTITRIMPRQDKTLSHRGKFSCKI
ncbi:hypothetical protein, partial [Brucella suis]|uniref:hypothetical protein n=1 Tax=Brucella suis TaxID=29461 RepID=UPI0024E199FF